MSVDFHTSLVEQLVVSVSKNLRLQMRTMFIRAETIIAALPESCGFSQQVCSEANQILQLSQTNIVKNYMMQINDQLKPVALMQQTEDLTDLIGQEEVDAMVVITEIHANAMNATGDSVYQLEARLEYLEIATDASFDKQAVSPKQLCEAYYEALVATGMKSTHIAVLLKLYDQTINRQLSDMYEALNSILIEADVMPEIIMDNHSTDSEAQSGLQTRAVNLL